MGGRGGSMGGSHGIGGGGAAAVAPAVQVAPQAAPVVQAVAPPAPPKPKPKQTREQQLLAQVKGNPAALMQMSDQDAADTVAAVEKQAIATDGSQRDCFVQRYMAEIGWATNKPELLTDAAYEKARKKAGEESMYHADKNFGGKTGKHYNQQLQTGSTAYYSEGYSGAGTYWAHNSAADSACYGRYQVKAFLNRKAKLVTTYTLANDARQLKRQKPKLYAALIGAKRGYGRNEESLYPILAAARGCNVIVRDTFSPQVSRSAGQYIVTLDRGALTMSKKTVAGATTYMNNW